MTEKIKHVAIIMDGNGRWAQERAHRRLWGHIRGSSVVSEIAEAASELGLKALTLYAFSTENWSRPLSEVEGLFSLLKKFLKKEEKKILANNIVFKIIGDSSRLPSETRLLIKNLEEKTAQNTGLKLSFAFSYGSRQEIILAINQFIEKNPNEKMTEEALEKELMTKMSGDVDLLIRTGGDQRISNFLLWQSAYAELFFTPTKWPDFTPEEFKSILEKVSRNERRFGGLGEATSLKDIQKKVGKNIGFFKRN